jgi:O-antigen/teichoic acid export membrane protein
MADATEPDAARALGSALRGSRLMFVRTVIDVSVNVLLSILFVRMLGQAALGAYIYASSLAALVYSVLALGITPIVTREIAKNPAVAPVLLMNGLAIRLSITLPLGLLAALALNSALSIEPEVQRVVWLVMTMVGLGLATDLIYGAFQAVGKFHYHLVLSGIHKLGMLALTAVALYLGFGLLTVIGLFVVMQVVSLTLAGAIATRDIGLRWGVRLSEWPSLVRASAPLALSAFSETVNNRSDTVLLGAMRGAGEVGVYGAAYNVYIGLCQLVNSFIVGGFPSMARLSSSRSASGLLMFNLALIIGATTAVAAGVVWLLSEPIIRLVYGANALEAAQPLGVLVFALTLFGLERLCLARLTTAGLQQFVFWATIVGAVVNVLANLILIPRFGFMGASYGTIISEAAILAAAVAFLAAPRATRLESNWNGVSGAAASRVSDG